MFHESRRVSCARYVMFDLLVLYFPLFVPPPPPPCRIWPGLCCWQICFVYVSTECLETWFLFRPKHGAVCPEPYFVSSSHLSRIEKVLSRSQKCTFILTPFLRLLVFDLNSPSHWRSALWMSARNGDRLPRILRSSHNVCTVKTLFICVVPHDGIVRSTSHECP